MQGVWKMYTYSSITSLEAADSLFCSGELVLRDNGLENFKNIIPELIVFLVQENYKPCALRVERRRDMENGLLSNFGNLLVGDGRLLIELVVGAALLDGLDKGLLGRHGVR